MTGSLKICIDCNEEKSWSEFWPASKWPDGSMRTPRSYCKLCGCRRNRETQRRREQRQGPLTPVDAEREIRLPIGPFRDWLLGEIESRGSLVMVAELSGLQERTLQRWLNEFDSVGLDLADRVLCACDQPEVLRDLYPALYAEAAA